MAEYHALDAREVLSSLNTNENGLSSTEAAERLRRYGPNELKKEKGITALTIFFDQFRNALILLLIFAALLSLFLGETLDSAAMFFIVTLSITLGFVQEYRAEKAIEALKKTASPTARVLREGNELKIPAKDIVQGDIILLEAGDIVPADSRIFTLSNLQIDEASLTGESVPSKKVTEILNQGISIADQENMAFMGTIITYGKARAIVTATGMQTELGKIAKSIQEAKETETPLQKKFLKLARQIGAGVIALILIIFIVGVLQKEASIPDMMLFSLSLTIAAVPNALPVIVTIGLSKGSRTLAKKNMLIKKLPAAESLGSVTIICSDKTGTLTKNEMTVRKIYANGKITDISGTGYEPVGEFSRAGKPADKKEFELLLRIGHLCNNAKLIEKDRKFGIIGDPTEGALLTLGKKGGLEDKYLSSNFSFIEELPFDSERKMMSVIFQNRFNNKKEAYIKGAPDLLLKKCDKIIENGKVRKMLPGDSIRIMQYNSLFAKNALRVLAIAVRDVSAISSYSLDTIEKNLTFVGLVGMIDPPRAEIKDSIAQCEQAGIEVMMITGDHPLTAEAIGKQIGLFKQGDIVLTGDDIEKMSDSELEDKISSIRVIARALPIQKSRIVDALKKNGHIVAMTGDGVNDAPAIKDADIGIAMGITGTDVAKEVSKAVLVDDNFATIVNAINEGRDIYDKMIKSVRYLLSCNSGEIVSVFTAIMLKFPLPLVPLQILLMNLLTDDLPAIGLGFEESDPDVMKRPPRDPKMNPITKGMFAMIVIFGIIMGAGTIFMFSRYSSIDLTKARTVAFTTLVMFEMFAVISSRSLLPSIKKLNPLLNPWLLGAIIISLIVQAAVVYIPFLQQVFGTAPLAIQDIYYILGMSFLGFIMMEASKFLLKIPVFHKNNSVIKK